MIAEKTDIVLVGGGGHCKSCIEVIESTGNYRIVGILDLPERVGFTVLGYKVIGTDEVFLKYKTPNCSFLITACRVKSPGLRKKIFNALENINAEVTTVVASTAFVSPHAQVGKGSVIMHRCIVNAAAEIGENCILNTGAVVEHDVKIGRHTHLSTLAVINGDCLIGNETFIGSGSIIGNGLQVGSSIVVGAGATVLTDIDEPGTYIGTPATKIS